MKGKANEGINKTTVGAIALGAVVLMGLAAVGKEAMSSGPPGESRNQNFGHPTPVTHGVGRSASSGGANLSQEQYYNNLKLNRPDLSEAELRAKTDHWWKVKNGESSVSGG